jgi:hypothetical protein
MITLKTLHLATEQEVFDQVAVHLLTQNKRSSNGITCVYRTGNGLKCAAGCLIADDEFKDEWETFTWTYLVKNGHITDRHHSLILNLQRIHDDAEEHMWQHYLLKLAEYNGLDPKVIHDLHTN